MMRLLSIGIALCLLTGCTMLSQPPASDNPMMPEAVDPSSLSPGQWCRVTLHEEKLDSVETRAEHIGQLQQTDGDSITLTEVTTRSRFMSTSPLHKVPYISRLYKNIRVAIQDEPAPVTVPRSRIEFIEPISPAEAAELKQGFERIGIDFDFNLATDK